MNRQGGQIISFPPAPSAPPTSVSTSDVTSSSITVQWGAVDCIHRNGDITGYSVRYGVQGSGITQTESVSGGATTEATISGLTHSTTYSIEVAAVNSAGTGSYSSSITAETDGERADYHIVICTGSSQEMHTYPLSLSAIAMHSGYIHMYIHSSHLFPIIYSLELLFRCYLCGCWIH